MTASDRPSEGQALLELSVSLAMLVPLVFGGFLLLRDYWIQTACLRAVFETARARLEGSPPVTTRFQVVTKEDTNSVTGTALCLKRTESVQLPKLDSLEPSW